jgi:hypothetical protein
MVYSQIAIVGVDARFLSSVMASSVQEAIRVGSNMQPNVAIAQLLNCDRGEINRATNQWKGSLESRQLLEET